MAKETCGWVSLTPIRDDDGSVRAVLGLSRDMTARKQAEDALRKSSLSSQGPETRGTRTSGGRHRA